LSRHFHAVSFSCLTGHREPESQAYLTAIRGLGVDARDCVFVGDGSSHELTGAAQLGMRVYRFRPEAVDMGDSIDADETWTGQALNDLQDLVAIASR
jgi:putative hydrolase of the HAD superfamily